MLLVIKQRNTNGHQLELLVNRMIILPDLKVEMGSFPCDGQLYE